MANVHKRLLKQKAVLWPWGDYDRYGDTRLGTKKEISCRYSSSDTFDGYSLTLLVGEYVDIGSVIWLGMLSEWWTGSADPFLYEVTGCNESSDLKCRHKAWELTLARFKGVLPA